MSTEKNQRRVNALSDQKSDSRTQLQSSLSEINTQIKEIGAEIDKVSQARYYIGRPSDADPTALFNKYKQQIKDLTDEFTYLSEAENTHSLVEATANLLKQMQIYTFLVNDYISDSLPQSINNTTESFDYLDKIQSPQALIRFLQHNISISQVKVQSENDKLKASILNDQLLIDNAQILIEKIDTLRASNHNALLQVQQKIIDLGGTYSIQSFSIKTDWQKELRPWEDQFERNLSDMKKAINDTIDLINDDTGFDIGHLKTAADRLKEQEEQMDYEKEGVELSKKNAETRKKNKSDSNTCLKWGNPASVPTYGHTFKDHGKKLKLQTLKNIARDTKPLAPQGQWLVDDQTVVDNVLTKELRATLNLGERQTPRPLPPGITGHVVYPNGDVKPANGFIAVPRAGGGYKTAYPVRM